MKQRNISASIQDINEIPKAISTFVGSSNMACEHYQTPGEYIKDGCHYQKYK